MEQFVNTIQNMDCLEFMKQLPNKCIDMILCDLPYGTTACKWDTIIPLEPMWEAYKRIIKDNGAIVLTASQPFTTDLINSNRKWFKYEWIWYKSKPSGIATIKYRPMKIHENILIFSKGKTIYNPIKEERALSSQKRLLQGKFETYNTSKGKQHLLKKTNKKCVSQLRYPTTVKFFPSKSNNKENYHPTQKPVALFSYLIKTYTNENDIVLDNCSGSGTTAISCLETSRKYICCELDSNYYDISLKRIDDYNKQLKLF